MLALGIVVRAVEDNGLAGALGHLVPGGTALPSLLAVAALAAVLANVINNLPAALVLLPLTAPAGPGAVLALLLGVNIGPNLTYAGSLATLLWRRIASTTPTWTWASSPGWECSPCPPRSSWRRWHCGCRCMPWEADPVKVIAWIVEGTWPACVDAARSWAPDGADVVLLHVTGRDIPAVGHGAYAGLLGRGHRERDPGTRLKGLAAGAAQQLLQAAAERLGRPCTRLERSGRVEHEVVAAADGAGLLIVARDGDRTRLGPKSLGPASRFVVDHAPCPVLLVWPRARTRHRHHSPAAPRPPHHR